VDKPFYEIKISLRPEAFDKIKAIRSQALEDNKLTRPDDDYVKALMIADGEPYTIKMRLKGDLGDHWKHYWKWSYRVKVKTKGERLWGMKKFSLQRPKTRNGYWEWLFHKTAKREGLNTLKTGFVHLFVNDRDYGAYNIEQAFSKDVLDYNGIEYGDDTHVIIKGDLKSYKIGSIRLRRKTSNLLRKYESKEMSPDEVFDLKQMTMYMALADLFGGFHAFYPENLRFIYDGDRLQPIVFDTMSGWKNFKLIIQRKNKNLGLIDFTDPILKSKEGNKEYRKALKKISSPEYVEGLIQTFGQEVKVIEEFTGKIDKKYLLDMDVVLKFNASRIRKYLNKL